jgi:hypothetical protein
LSVDFIKFRVGGTHIVIPSRFMNDDIFNLIKLGALNWLGGITLIWRTNLFISPPGMNNIGAEGVRCRIVHP